MSKISGPTDPHLREHDIEKLKRMCLIALFPGESFNFFYKKLKMATATED